MRKDVIMREMGPNRAERVDRNHLDETEGLGIVITMRAVLPEVARRFHKGHEICKQALGLEQDSASLIDGNRSFKPPRPATCCAQHNAGLRLAGRLSTKPAPGAHRGGIGAACQPATLVQLFLDSISNGSGKENGSG
jgi:hypothetical protein